MPRIISNPTRIPSVGTRPKIIDEFVGNVATGHREVSVARMNSPVGWAEPGQRPEFLEVTFVLEGSIRVEFEGGEETVQAGQAVVAEPGEWVRYSTPDGDGARYIAVCVPGFSPDSVHRDD